jgi:hypothetical protein
MRSAEKTRSTTSPLSLTRSARAPHRGGVPGLQVALVLVAALAGCASQTFFFSYLISAAMTGSLHRIKSITILADAQN